MNSLNRRGGGRRPFAFTLIELLVVVAIIALLISILLPSLSKAREQARTTLCLSRIAQFGQAFMLYADDYDGTPPFVVSGHGDITDCNETWLGAKDDLEEIHHARQEDWPDFVSIPRSGDLFVYARFENLYRCPEFERVQHEDKAQEVWNYTRAVWGRYWQLKMELDDESASEWGDVQGPILKISAVHNPAEMGMILDEQWNRHCATAGLYGDDGSGYNCNDWIFHANNIIAVSHGTPVTSSHHRFDYRNGYTPFLWKRGGVYFYDGHAALMRDPWPTFELGGGDGLAANLRGDPEEFRLHSTGARSFDEYNGISEFMCGLIFSQRGFDPRQRYANDPIRPWGS